MKIVFFAFLSFTVVLNKFLYSVIEFVPQTESDEEEILVEVVPTKWISEDKQFCYYPPRFMRGKCMKMVMSLVDYNSSTWELLPIIFHHSYSTFNVARKARNKAVKEDTIVATDVETDYNKPRKRKPPEHLTFSSDSESVEESKKKKLKERHNIPKPSSTLPSKLKKLFESSKAKNLAKSTNKYFANSNLSPTSSKKNTTPVRRLSQEESTQSESTNKENLSDNEISSEDSCSHSKLKNSASNNRSLRSPNSSNNFDLSEKSSTCEQSSQSQDILTKSDYDDMRQINKKNNSPNRSTSLKRFLEDSQSSPGPASSKPQDQLILNYMQELSTKIDWLHIKISQILNELFPNNNAFDKPEGFLSLPLETEESFVNFDNHLNNKVLYGQMLTYLLQKGKGETTSIFTYSILSTLLRNNVARLISWKGSGGIKLSFQKSKVKNLIEGVCFKKFPEVQISIFEDHMKRWFNTSMQRSD